MCSRTVLNIYYCVECINATEIAHQFPMEHNPIYEGGVIYEEIADARNFKSLSQPTPPCKVKEVTLDNEREVGYVSISGGSLDKLESVSCN